MTPRPPTVAFATCAAQPQLYAEEQRLLPMLADRGVEARAVVWDDPAVDWAGFDVVFLRSVWDYFEKYAAFRRWLSGLAAKGVQLQNPVALVEWNADKRYLADLAARGVALPPTAFLAARQPADLPGLLRERGWERAVVKPAVSGGAWRTQVVTRADAGAHAAALQAMLQDGDALVQPFLPEVQEEGEWSLLFFGGEFSHAVLKRPAAGDYRVQPQFGGQAERVQPEARLLAQARAVLAALPQAPAYARIDGLRRGGDFLLMEAELIEPYLFCNVAPEAMETYVALVERTARAAAGAR